MSIWEGRLRSPALRQLQLVDSNAKEGETARNEGVVRRVIAVPGVEHVSVLFSMTAVNEALAWIDSVYARQSSPVVASPGIWILLLLAGIVLLLKPLIQWLPANGLPTNRRLSDVASIGFCCCAACCHQAKVEL